MLAVKATKLTMEVNELKETMFNEFGADMFNSMDGKTFEFIQKCFKVADHSMKIVEEQAVTIQKINEKLDKLLAIKDRA